MNTKLNYIEQITTLLNLKGVGERKHASTIASILGIQYNSAKQKLDGKRGITLDEIKSIFKYFGEPFLGLRNHNCVFIMNSIHKRCNVEVFDKAVLEREVGQNYAIEKDGLYIIDVSNLNPDNGKYYKVINIDFLPPPKIAILDNDQDILYLLKKTCLKYGFEADIFTTKDDLLESMKNNNYEAYILDWLLDYGITSGDIVTAARLDGSNTPIIILTGQLNHYEQSISNMIMYHNVSLIEKPARSLIISSFLISNIFFT